LQAGDGVAFLRGGAVGGDLAAAAMAASRARPGRWIVGSVLSGPAAERRASGVLTRGVASGTRKGAVGPVSGWSGERWRGQRHESGPSGEPCGPGEGRKGANGRELSPDCRLSGLQMRADSEDGAAWPAGRRQSRGTAHDWRNRADRVQSDPGLERGPRQANRWSCGPGRVACGMGERWRWRARGVKWAWPQGPTGLTVRAPVAGAGSALGVGPVARLRMSRVRLDRVTGRVWLWGGWVVTVHPHFVADRDVPPGHGRLARTVPGMPPGVRHLVRWGCGVPRRAMGRLCWQSRGLGGQRSGGWLGAGGGSGHDRGCSAVWAGTAPVGQNPPFQRG